MFRSILIFVSIFSIGSASMASTVCSSTSCGKYLLAHVTISNATLAKELAHKLVTGKLAACVNIVPTITSIYQWKGKIEEDSETLLIVKTEDTKRRELVEFVRQNHPYSVPEVIFTSIVDGNPDYLKWLHESVN